MLILIKPRSKCQPILMLLPSNQSSIQRLLTTKLLTTRLLFCLNIRIILYFFEIGFLVSSSRIKLNKYIDLNFERLIIICSINKIESCSNRVFLINKYIYAFNYIAFPSPNYTKSTFIYQLFDLESERNILLTFLSYLAIQTNFA